jgi:uncharacterized protein (DUF1778 family)
MYGDPPYMVVGLPYVDWSLSMAQALRTERTEARLLPEQKARIERAAQLKGLSISDFIVQHADEAAIRTIQLHTSWSLTDRDRDFFVKTLLDPPKPNKRLRAAVERYRKQTGKK